MADRELREVLLSGSLARRFGRRFYLDVQSPAEAVRALCCVLKGFRQHLRDSEALGLTYAVFEGKRNIGPEELRLNGTAPIRIVPMLMGSARRGVWQTVLGIVLIVVGVVLSETGYGAALVEVGVSMLIGGVVQLLTPTPKDPGAGEAPAFFNGAVNTTAQGNCVPYLAGEMIVGSAVISAGLESVSYPGGIDPNTGTPVISYG